MGCCLSKTDGPYQAPLPSAVLLRSATLSGLNTKDLPSRVSNHIKKLNTLNSQLDKKTASAKQSKDDFCKNLDGLELYFSQKSMSEERLNLDDVECPICLLLYNNDEEKPLELSCGHNICMKCAGLMHTEKKNLECPLDLKITFLTPTDFSPNMEVLSKIEAIEKHLFCFSHNLRIYKFCLDCKKLVCNRCIVDHNQHLIKAITDDDVCREALGWEKKLSEYMQSLKNSKEKLISCDEDISKTEERLRIAVDGHVEQVKIFRDKVIEGLIAVSEIHINDVKEKINDLVMNLPKYKLKLYKDSIGSEIEKTDEVILKYKDLSLEERLHNISKSGLKKSQSSIEKKFESSPWNDSVNFLSEINDFEAFILALISK